MDGTKEMVYIFSHGQISNGPSGVTFECDNIKVIKVDRNISLTQLKLVIGRKLHLRPNQIVAELIYRCPTCLNPPRYGASKLEEDVDVTQMWEVTRAFSAHLTFAEVYANVCDLPYEGNVESQPMTRYDRNTLPSSSDEVNIVGGHGSMFTNDMENFHSLDNPNMSNINGPPSPTPYEDDVDDDDEDEDEDEDEYDSYLNVGNEDDDDDSDNDEEVIPEHNDRAIGFLSRIPNEQDMPRELGDLGGSLNFNDTEDLYIGKTFTDIRVLRRAVKLYSVRVHHTFRVFHCSKKYEEYRCIHYGQSCNWRARACKKEHRNFWEITRYNGPHTCLNPAISQDHPKLDADVISSCIVAMVTDKPDVKISQIIERMQSMFGYSVTYRKAWRAKQLAIATVFGNWETSYSLLPRWLVAIQHFMPGSCVHFVNKPTDILDSNGQPVEMFRRVFWAFQPCINAFPYLKPIIQVDGTFLYGKYKGTLLMAISQDGDRNVVPLAFAIVEGETRSAWAWFLRLVRHVVARDATDTCLISDRHPAILAAVGDPQVGWQPPQGHHVFCLRHIASNLRKAHGTTWLKEKFVNIGYAYEQHVVDQQLAELSFQHQAAARWIRAIPLAQWSRAYDVDGRRFGHMTTNLAECMNNVFKGVRSLPILGLVKATLYRVNNYFVQRAHKVHAQMAAGQVFSETVTKKLERVTQSSSACLVREFNRRSTTFEVAEQYNNNYHQFGRCCKVNLIERKCDCGEFQAERYPCMHAVAACAQVGIDHSQYVHHVFRLETMKKAYDNEFQPMGDGTYWPQFDWPTLIPDPATVRQKGRPRSSRIRNEMDWTTSTSTNRCGLCRQSGHNRSSCPSRSNDM